LRYRSFMPMLVSFLLCVPIAALTPLM
jgi:hypothetical protein